MLSPLAPLWPDMFLYASDRNPPVDMAWRLGWQKWARGDSRPFSRRTEVRAWLRELGILQRDSDTP